MGPYRRESPRYDSAYRPWPVDSGGQTAVTPGPASGAGPRSLLSVDHLTVRSAGRVLLGDVSFSVPSCELFLVVGYFVVG